MSPLRSCLPDCVKNPTESSSIVHTERGGETFGMNTQSSTSTDRKYTNTPQVQFVNERKRNSLTSSGNLSSGSTTSLVANARREETTSSKLNSLPVTSQPEKSSGLLTAFQSPEYNELMALEQNFQEIKSLINNHEGNYTDKFYRDSRALLLSIWILLGSMSMDQKNPLYSWRNKLYKEIQNYYKNLQNNIQEAERNLREKISTTDINCADAVRPTPTNSTHEKKPLKVDPQIHKPTNLPINIGILKGNPPGMISTRTTYTNGADALRPTSANSTHKKKPLELDSQIQKSTTHPGNNRDANENPLGVISTRTTNTNCADAVLPTPTDAAHETKPLQVDPQKLLILPVVSKSADYSTQLNQIETKFAEIRTMTDDFEGKSSDKLYKYLDQMLVNFLISLDAMNVDKQHDLYPLRRKLYRQINQCCEDLEEKGCEEPEKAEEADENSFAEAASGEVAAEGCNGGPLIHETLPENVEQGVQDVKLTKRAEVLTSVENETTTKIFQEQRKSSREAKSDKKDSEKREEAALKRKFQNLSIEGGKKMRIAPQTQRPPQPQCQHQPTIKSRGLKSTPKPRPVFQADIS